MNELETKAWCDNRVRNKARIYAPGNGATLRTYCRNLIEAHRLRRYYGCGNYYKHRNGYSWVVCKKRDIAKVIRDVSPCPRLEAWISWLESF
jgi:hypothetical protein